MRTFAITLMALALGGAARAADDEVDPEPQSGAQTLKKIKGTWNATRYIINKAEQKAPPYTYAFEGDKMTYSYRGRVSYTATITPDKTRKDAFTMKRDNSTITTKYFYKIEKGELFLALDRSNDPKAKADFSGDSGQVIVFEQQK